MKTYRVSALASALVRMWRAWSVIVPVVIVNALVQAALVWWDASVDTTWVLIAAVVISAFAFVLSYGLVASAALVVPESRVGLGRAWQGLRARLLPFLLWALLLLALVAVSLAIHLLVAVLVVGLTAFLLLAVLDERPSPVLVNLRTIGRRFWRWLATGVVVSLVIVVGIGLMGVTQFFLRDFLGALVVWLVAGLVIAWLIVARALIYRNAWGLAPDNAAEPEPVMGRGATPDLA